MTWTRRQFGLWTTAALLVPSAMAEPGADPPAKPLKSLKPSKTPPGKAARVGMDALELRVVFASRTETELSYQLVGHNHGAKGLSVGLSGVSAGDDGNQRMAWFNDQHPMSRRLAVPSFVDVPVGGPLLLATITIGRWVGATEAALTAPEALTLRLMVDGTFHEIWVPLVGKLDS